MSPLKRRSAAITGLVLTVVAWVVFKSFYLLGAVSHQFMDAVTNDLSFLAIVFTMLDVVATTDVRVREDS